MTQREQPVAALLAAVPASGDTGIELLDAVHEVVEADDKPPERPAAQGSSDVVDVFQPIPEQVDPLLVQILSWPRKHDSFQELQFCKWLRETITGYGASPTIKSKGCIVVEILHPPTSKIMDGETETLTQPYASTTLFSCHIDTVDTDLNPDSHEWVQDEKKGWVKKEREKSDTPLPTRKQLTYDPVFGHICLDKGSIGGSLGSDDGVGVWIMLRMIEAKVPGTYVFHRGEEVGGVGSGAMATEHAVWLRQFEAAIAFDRPRNNEIITHQRGGRCCSEKFGLALANRLNTIGGFKFATSDKGVFTDTANYRTLIAECTNIGVGYEGHHTRQEMLDYAHAFALKNACLTMAWDSLPIDRDPAKQDSYSYGGTYQGQQYGGYQGNGYGRSGSLLDDDDEFNFPGRYGTPAKGTKKKDKSKKRSKGAANEPVVPQLGLIDELCNCSLEELEDYVHMNADDAAAIIGKLIIKLQQQKSTISTLMHLLGWKGDTDAEELMQ